MNLHSLCQLIRARFVIGSLDKREDCARRAHDGFLGFEQLPDHVFSAWDAFGFRNRRELRIRPIAAWRRKTERKDAFGDDINRNGELSVVGLKHRMPRIELRDGHAPVKVTRFQIQGIGIGQQAGQALSDIFTIHLPNADINGGGSVLHGTLRLAFIDRILKCLAGSKFDRFARSNADRLSGFGITSGTRGPFTQRIAAKANQLHWISFGDGLLIVSSNASSISPVKALLAPVFEEMASMSSCLFIQFPYSLSVV